MTHASLLDACKEHDLYRTPYINDKLYLNFKGYARIENLEEYTGLKALFLEGNAFETLDGIPTLPLLRCLCDTTRAFSSCCCCCTMPAPYFHNF